MKVMVIAAHVDDEVLGCGGVMARHVDHGDEVHVAIVTRPDPQLFSQELAQTLRRELPAAMEVLGVRHTENLEFLAPHLDHTPQQELSDSIGQAIRRADPHTLYIPHRGDCHADHRAIFHAALVAARPIRGCSVRRVLCYETLSETEWSPPFAESAFCPTYFVDVGPYLSKKLEAMARYASQVQDPPHPRSLQALEDLARLRGSAVGLEAAEAFVVVRDIVQ